jgi:hypothetical protein
MRISAGHTCALSSYQPGVPPRRRHQRDWSRVIVLTVPTDG